MTQMYADKGGLICTTPIFCARHEDLTDRRMRGPCLPCPCLFSRWVAGDARAANDTEANAEPSQPRFNACTRNALRARSFTVNES